MSNILKKSFPLIFFILKLCIEISDARVCLNFTIQDLDIICGIMDGETVLSAIPPQCTAIAEYTSNMEKLRAAYTLKGHLPFMILVDSVDYKDPSAIDKLNDVLKDINFDFAAFNLHQFLKSQEDVQDSTEYVRKWISNMRDQSQFAVGFLIENDIPWLLDKRKLNFGPINNVTDFYLLQSTGYRDCDYHKNQIDMPALATKDDVLGSVQALQGMKMDLKLLLYTIELKVESKYVVESGDMSYSHLCSTKMSVHRKYCFQTIECLFDKARIRIDHNCSGIFVMGIEYDDTDGKCGCKTATDPDPCFRGLKTIAGASQEKTNPVSFYTCKEGAFPTIL